MKPKHFYALKASGKCIFSWIQEHHRLIIRWCLVNIIWTLSSKYLPVIDVSNQLISVIRCQLLFHLSSTASFGGTQPDNWYKLCNKSETVGYHIDRHISIVIRVFLNSSFNVYVFNHQFLINQWRPSQIFTVEIRAWNWWWNSIQRNEIFDVLSTQIAVNSIDRVDSIGWISAIKLNWWSSDLFGSIWDEVGRIDQHKNMQQKW